jgi:UPF0716 protein FxsA
MGKLLLLFLALPVLDLYLLLRLGHALGAGVALSCVVVSAIAGVTLARRSALRELRGWRETLATGRPPQRGVVEPLLSLLACAWLITPGLLSDALALLLLVPRIRRRISALATEQVLAAIQRGALRVMVQSPGPAAAPREPRPPSGVIDVEAEVVHPDSPARSTRKPLSP